MLSTGASLFENPDAWPWGAFLVGYAFAFLADIPLNITMLYAWDTMLREEPGDEDRQNKWQPHILGHCERAIVVTSIIFGFPEAIAGWLVLKAAGNWQVYYARTTDESAPKQIGGRQVFNLTLFGTALSVGYGAVGAAIVLCWASGWYLHSAVAVCAVVGFHGFAGLYIVAFRKHRSMGWWLERCRTMSGAWKPSWGWFLGWFVAMCFLVGFPQWWPPLAECLRGLWSWCC